MERKACSICAKNLSNVYNLKRHMKRAHGALLDPKTGVINYLRNDISRSISPLSSDGNEDDTRAHSSGSRTSPCQDDFPGLFLEWNSSPDSVDVDNVEAPDELPQSQAPAQSFFQAFIPPKYQLVEDGLYEDYISDDDNLNYIDDADLAAKVLRDTSGAGRKLLSADDSQPQNGTPASIESCKLARDKLAFAAGLGLVARGTPKEVDRVNNNDSISDKNAASTVGLTSHELRSYRKETQQRLMEKINLYHDHVAFKNSTEGKAERARLLKKGG